MQQSDLRDLIKQVTREPVELVEAQLREDLGSELETRSVADLRTDIESAAEMVKFDLSGARDLAERKRLL